MIPLHDTISMKYYYSNGVRTYQHDATLHLRTGLSGKFGMVITSFAGGTSASEGALFLALDAALTGINDYLQFDVTYDSGSSSGQNLDVTSWYYTAANSIDSTTAQETTARNITNAYNDLYGTSLTNAQVYAELKRIYGNYECFAYSLISGRLCSRATGAGGSSYGFVDDPSITTLGQDICSTWVASSFTDAWKAAFTGEDIAIASDMVTTIGSDFSKLRTYLIFSSAITPEKLRFDVYVTGTKDPNITVKWSEETQGDDFSLQTVNPNVWGHPHAIIEGVFTPIIFNGDANVPNDSQWYVMRHSYTWAGSYSVPYLTEYNNIVDLSGYSTLAKVTAYGIDGIANYMHYYLRFNQQINVDNQGVMTYGTLFDIKVPRNVNALSDITVTQIANSEHLPQFETEVYIHLGSAPDDTPDDNDDYPDGQDYDGNDEGVYDPTKPIPDFSSDESTGFSGNAVLTRTYTMPASILENVGSKLWSQSYYDVLKVQSNPIENVVGVKWFPFSIGGALTNIKVGNIDFGVQGHLTDSIYKFTIGSVKYTPATSKASYLDCSPYTTLKLHLPYCGIVQLDASECLNRTIWVDYVVDLVTGDCMALIYLDRTSDNLGIPYMNVSGHCGVDIPLTATNRVQTEMRAASQTISAVVGAAAHVVSGDIVGAATGAGNAALSIGGMDYTSQRTSSHSPACTSKANRACYLEISRPARDADSAGFEKRHGYPCNKYKTLSSLSGFIKCDARTRIDFAVTSRENEMIEQLLTTGVYV